MNREEADKPNPIRLPSFRLGHVLPCVEPEPMSSNPNLKMEELRVAARIQDVQWGEASSSKSFARVALVIEVDLAKLETMPATLSCTPSFPRSTNHHRTASWQSLRARTLDAWTSIRAKTAGWRVPAWPWIAATAGTVASATLLSILLDRSPSPHGPGSIEALDGSRQSCAPARSLPRGAPLETSLATSLEASGPAPPKNSAVLERGRERTKERARSARARAAKKKRGTSGRRSLPKTDAQRLPLYPGTEL